MKNLPTSYADITRALKEQGYAFGRNGKGSHEIWVNENPESAQQKSVSVPKPHGDKKNLARGTAHNILKSTGWLDKQARIALRRDEFIETKNEITTTPLSDAEIYEALPDKPAEWMQSYPEVESLAILKESIESPDSSPADRDVAKSMFNEQLADIKDNGNMQKILNVMNENLLHTTLSASSPTSDVRSLAQTNIRQPQTFPGRR